LYKKNRRLTPIVVFLAEDHMARNEAFWFRGGILPDKAMIKKKEGALKAHKKKR
jgi:hypothetical protein